jgi:hypothetical protein
MDGASFRIGARRRNIVAAPKLWLIRGTNLSDRVPPNVTVGLRKNTYSQARPLRKIKLPLKQAKTLHPTFREPGRSVSAAFRQ